MIISREKEKKFGENLPQCFFSFTHHDSNEKSPCQTEHKAAVSSQHLTACAMYHIHCPLPGLYLLSKHHYNI
jgi:hypothetical protein